MKTILGLDLGTTSIGWAVVKEAESSEEKSSIVRVGVRVNPLTVDEQTNFNKGKPMVLLSVSQRYIVDIVRKNKVEKVKVGVRNLLLRTDIERVMNERKMKGLQV